MKVLNYAAALPGASARTRSLVARLRANRDEGQSLLEFALCLPVLLIILTGITTFAVALNNYIVLTQALGASAQYLSISRNNTTDPCKDAATAFVNAAPNLNSSKLAFSYTINGSSYPSSGSYNGSSNATCTSGATSMQTPGASLTMTVTYPCNLAIYGRNFMPSCNLQAQATEIIQ